MLDPTRLAAGAGIALLVLVVAPYAMLDPGTVGVYYAAGPVSPPLLLTFGAVALVALLSGAAGRSDPATTAGVAVTLAAVTSLLALAWALSAGAAAGGIETAATFDYHRWAVAAASLLLLAGAGWSARRTLG